MLLAVIFIGGNVYWLLLALGFKKVWMYFAVGFPLTALVTGPIGAWALVFGTPIWLTELATDDDSPNTKLITDEQLGYFSENYNATLPSHISADMTIVSSSVPSKQTLKLTLVWEDGPDLDPYLENPEMGNAIMIDWGCSDQKLRKNFLEKGITMVYVVYKSDGTYLIEVEFDGSDCPE